MKRILIKLISFLFIPASNLLAQQDTVLRKDAYLFVQGLFQKDYPSNFGIIATIPVKGRVTISMYEYSPLGKDHKGALLFEVYTDVSTNNFSGTPYLIKHDNLGSLAPFILGDWTSNDAKVTTLALAAKNSRVNAGLFQPLLDQLLHVVLEITIEQANLNEFKFPGFPVMNEGFFTDRFAKVLDAIRNPLLYPDYTIVAAHRGYWKDVPENSLAAYDLTVESGADMVELDTRLTRDDTLVAFHDECLDRITTGSGKLRDHTWSELKQLQLKDRFGTPTQYKIVSIRDALLYLKGRALVNLDLKERITKDSTGKVIDLLTPTFKAALKIAKETGTLKQLVVKGKFRADDLQEIT